MFFDDSRPDRAKRAARKNPLRAGDFAASPIPPAKPYEFLTEAEITKSKLELAFDVESYGNYFLIGFMCVNTRKVIFFECDEDQGFTQDQRQKIVFLLLRHKVIGFNSANYDMTMLAAALMGLPSYKLADITHQIIVENMRPQEVSRYYNLSHINADHIDVKEVAPLEGSLKLYGARIHTARLQDLPYEPGSMLNSEQKVVVRDYNVNDLTLTTELYLKLKPQIELRERLSAQYSIDLRSKSDAQIAEAVIASELRKLGLKVKRPEIEPFSRFKYQIPHFVKFKTPQFKAVLDALASNDFEIGASGRVECPPWLKALKPKLNKATYEVGIGGLH